MRRNRPDRPSLARPVDVAPSRSTSGGNRMKPARSFAFSVVALGFAGSVAAPPLPAYAAPAPCERAEGYAAQSGVELLRIDRLELRSGGGERPVTKDEAPADPSSHDQGSSSDNGGDPGDKKGAAARVLNSGNLDPAANGDDGDTISEGIGMLGQAVVGSVLPGNGMTPRAGGTESDTGGQGGGSVMRGPQVSGAET